MKKIIFVASLAIVFTASNAQIEEKKSADWQILGRLKFGGITKAKMEFTASGTDTTYMLLIKDVRDQPENHYFSITFKGINETYEKFYAILKSFFLPENKKNKRYSRTFNLGNISVNVQYHQLITGRGVIFSTNDGYTYWSEKDIDKLFGKD